MFTVTSSAINIIFILSNILNLCSSTSAWVNEFDYNVYLDDANQFRLYWTEKGDNTIELGIEVNATGWIAIGISPNGQMPNSDIMFGWVSDDGTVYLQDRYTISQRSYPLYDIQQDLTLISGQQMDGMTRIRFTRPKVSCDPNNQDLSFNEGTTRMIYAWNKDTDPTKEYFDANSVQWHGPNKGTQPLNLDTGIPEPVQLEADTEYFDLTMDKVHVPAADTTYYCKLFKLPVFNKTHHIVKVAPVVDNVEILHHLITFVCPAAIAEKNEGYADEGDCDYWDVPARKCTGGGINYGWAVGGNALYYPKEAGMPMSGDSELYYVVLQIHYNNPAMKSGYIDSSGIRLWHTPTLREYDAGLLSVGTIVNPYGQFIPPGLEYTMNSGFCTSDCTSNGIKGKNITDGTIYAFASLLHAHTIAVALNLRQIRDGVELPNIDKNWAYDFNYQQTIIFEEPKEIKAGDEFIMDCYINSTGRDWITVGGESTSQEMCLGFVYVYPAPELSICWTSFTHESMENWLNDAQKAGYLQGNVTEAIDDWEWDGLSWNESVPNAEEFYNTLWEPNGKYEEHWEKCVAQNGTWLIKYDTTDDLIRVIPDNFTVYHEEKVNCNTTDMSTTDMIQSTEIISDKLEAKGLAVGIVIGIIAVAVCFCIVVIAVMWKCFCSRKYGGHEMGLQLMSADYNKLRKV